ncbi:MAG: TonB-dependent receptor family protein [Gammaproteobacteria bacterium]
MISNRVKSVLVLASLMSGEALVAQERNENREAYRLPAMAQTDNNGSAYALPPINVEGTIPEEIQDTPGAASRLTEEEIDTYRPYTLHDAFDFVPGVKTLEDDVLGRRSGIGIRGAPSRRSRKTLLLEDGVPINGSTYLDPSAHYTPPLERLEAIEVLKGAGHILHGPLNNHGIVNFRNKRATLLPETTAELGIGEDPDTFERHLMHTRTNGPLGLVFAYTGLNADGSFDVEDFEYNDFFTSIDWEVNPRHDLGFSATYFRERSNYDESNLAPVEFALNPRQKLGRFGNEFNTIAIDYWKFGLKHDFEISDDLSMSTQLFSTDLDRPRFTVDPEEIFVDALPDFVYVDPETEFIPGVQGQMVSRDRHYRTYGAESRFQWADIEALGLNHTFQWGVRFERHFLDDFRSEGGPGEILTEENRGVRSVEDAYQASAYSVFLQDALRFGDWTITPGVRAEYYTQKKTENFDEDGFIGESQDDDNTLVLPAISVLYEGIEDTQLFANVGRGYTPAFARTAEEFPLEPETGINSQLGFRTFALPGVALDGAVFYNDIQDTVVQLPFTVEGVNVVVNAEDSESYGTDLGMELSSAAMTGSDFNFFSRLAYNYTHAEFTSGEIDGNRVPEIPEHAGSLSVGLEHTSGWHVSATVTHFGSFFNDLLETEELTLADEDREPVEPGDTIEIREPAVLGEVPGHTLYSARASYTFQREPDITLWIQGRNLTDKFYIGDIENGVRPGFERTVVAGITVQF